MLFIHFANVYLSDLTKEEDPCSLYFINFLLDATLGMLLIYAGVRAVSTLVEWQQWESLRFGEYGGNVVLDPDECEHLSEGGTGPSSIKGGSDQTPPEEGKSGPVNINNSRPVANIPFLGKLLEQVVARQLQTLLEKTDHLDSFRSDFRTGFRTETALVTLWDDLCQEKDRGVCPCWFFWTSQ
ncbi:Store-operated calcium entry regulator STIMATE [Varanus komodoensis]|nr:Store-operated calcium entry regulator STIMATE [Varanus komodoensis]